MARCKGKSRKNKKSETKEKWKRMTYSRSNWVYAVNDVREGESIASISRTYGVPKSTIRARVQGKYADKKPGADYINRKRRE